MSDSAFRLSRRRLLTTGVGIVDAVALVAIGAVDDGDLDAAGAVGAQAARSPNNVRALGRSRPATPSVGRLIGGLPKIGMPGLKSGCRTHRP